MDASTVKTLLLEDSFVYYPNGLALYDKEGEIVDVNRAIYAKFGINDKSEFLINNLFTTTLLTDLQKEHLRHGSMVKDMSVITFSIIPSFNKTGDIIGYTLLLTDSPITEIGVYHDYLTRELIDLSEKITESVPDTILLVNRKLTIERIIAVASETGITPASLGCKIYELPGYTFSPEVVEKIKDTAHTCLEEERVMKVELSLPGKVRPLAHVKIRVVPMQQRYMLAYIRNVTELIEKERENQRLSERLSESRMMMELALQNSKIATYSFNFELFNRCDRVHCQRCFQFHGAANELLLRNKYICRALTTLRHPDDRNDFFFLFKEIRDHKLKEEKVVFRMKNNEGEYRSYEVSGKTQEYDAEGFPKLIIGLIMDDQERLEYEASLIEAKEKAETADQLKSTFLANMTHEIRSPLHAIVGFSDLLNTETEESIREEYMNLIKMNNDLLVRLINDILDISKIEADMMTFSYMSVNMPLFMRDIYGTMRLRMPDSVMLILDPCPDIVFLTDRSRLSQILINLLTNAIKHTAEGTIRFGYILTATDIEFYISDTGAGIPEEKLEQIFSRFVQLKGAKQGIGLGLAICKGLVTKLGGDIWATSKEGEGSTFSFRLPLYRDPKSL